MSKTYYSEEHEWITVDGGVGTVGITDYAQQQLGDIVFVEIAKLGEAVGKDDEVGVVESVKAASDIYTPVSGTISAWNEALESGPETVNADPAATGWIFKIDLGDPGELETLMDEAAYAAFLETL